MNMRKKQHRKSRHALSISAVALVALLGAGPRVDAGARARQDDPDSRGRGDDTDKRIDNLQAFGLTDDGRLVRFRIDSPDRARTLGHIAGFAGSDTTLVGIDFRVQDGLLYGVGNAGGVYTIDTTTARLTLSNPLTVPLNGTFFGVDFNPAADRLRIISDAGQNLAHNVNAGGVTAVNATLTYTAPPAAPVAAPGVTAAAYTNNDLNQPGTATTLFDLDTTMDQVVIQSPPGNGILVATGRLGVDVNPSAGFDIFTRLSRGVAVSNTAFATFAVGDSNWLFHIDLLTGKALHVGRFDDRVVDIALDLDQ
jgi:Domain of unknown function (DUF4394)